MVATARGCGLLYHLTHTRQQLHLRAFTDTAMKPATLSVQLRTAIKTSGKTVYQLAKESGVSHPVILRFLSGERGIRMDTADRLAYSLGLRLK